MEINKLESLKIAANQFYLGKYLDQPLMEDVEFDSLRKEFELSGDSVKSLVDWDSSVQMINDPMEPLNKIIAYDNNLGESIQDYMAGENYGEPQKYYMNYKYDGSSIKAYYKNGKLQRILGTPDEDYGFVRTKAFFNLFPHNVDPSIKTLQGEVLVDAGVYGELARNKANGLTNSKNMDEEVECEAFIRIYRIVFVDEDYNFERQKVALANLPRIYRTRMRWTNPEINDVNESIREFNDLVFAPAYQWSKFEDCPTKPIVDTEVGVKFQVDGVVLYHTAAIQGFKFYYTEYADVEVLEVIWNRKSNGSYAPILSIRECILNDKFINYVTTSGVPNLMNGKMGRGSIVRVILANMTIPKVIDVLKESEDYQWPKCECGYQMSSDDIYGATLKCGRRDKSCSHKTRTWLIELVHNIVYSDKSKSGSFDDYYADRIFELIDALHIDRWTAESKYIGGSIESLRNDILNSIENHDFLDFSKCILNNFSFTELNMRIFNINTRSTFEALIILHRDWDVNLDYYNMLIELE